MQEIPINIIKNSQWESVKSKRNKLISEVDWTQMDDSPLSQEKKDEFKLYRQKLRDIPQDFDDPFSVVFPIKPD